jgi:hypothetical protein
MCVSLFERIDANNSSKLSLNMPMMIATGISNAVAIHATTYPARVG